MSKRGFLSKRGNYHGRKKSLKIVSEKPVSTNIRFKFKMLLPKSIEGQKTLYLEAESKWSRQAANPDLYDNGFQLLNVKPGDEKIIEKLMRTSSFNY